MFASKTPEDLPKKRKMVQMSIRFHEKLPLELPFKSIITIEKNFFFSEKNLMITAKLDSSVYQEADQIMVSLAIKRPGGHGVRRIRLTAIQQVNFIILLMIAEFCEGCHLQFYVQTSYNYITLASISYTNFLTFSSYAH